MKFIDYYEVLQISPTASIEIIKVAYRQLSKMYHPDTSNYDDKKFINIKEAYTILSDAQKRQEYDVLWRQTVKGNLEYRKEEKVIGEEESLSLSKRSEKVINKRIMLMIIVFIAFFILWRWVEGSSYGEDSSIATNITVSEYSIPLPKEDYSKVKTTEHILDYGEAYFDIYNGTNFTIKNIIIEINVKNENGDIIDTRQFQKDVFINPLSTENEIHITTGIVGLPRVGENDLRIQPKYISWSYTQIIGDKL